MVKIETYRNYKQNQYIASRRRRSIYQLLGALSQLHVEHFLYCFPSFPKFPVFKID